MVTLAVFLFFLFFMLLLFFLVMHSPLAYTSNKVKHSHTHANSIKSALFNCNLRPAQNARESKRNTGKIKRCPQHVHPRRMQKRNY